MEKRQGRRMESLRKPYQGVWNIVRFNWHYYAFSAAFAGILLLSQNYFGYHVARTLNIVSVFIVLSVAISLCVSAYIYDFSALYRFDWLIGLGPAPDVSLLNINAGFDETSTLLKARFGTARLIVFDFYDEVRHTEVSIKRARKAYPPYPGTQQVTTRQLPLKDGAVDRVFAILSAHEIREEQERKTFFIELARVLSQHGQVIIVEHLRDTANFLAYNIGFLHFHSRATWLKAFQAAGLRVDTEFKITPFITTFILKKDGTAH
jgi:ubiquinone/menaquinone biosynthesis C-methylase UbiE